MTNDDLNVTTTSETTETKKNPTVKKPAAAKSATAAKSAAVKPSTAKTTASKPRAKKTDVIDEKARAYESETAAVVTDSATAEKTDAKQEIMATVDLEVARKATANREKIDEKSNNDVARITEEKRKKRAQEAGLTEEREVLVSMRNVKTYFPVKKGVFKRTVGHVKAVDGINLDIYRGETLGLVGESGCGKSTLGKTLLQLVPATAGKMDYKFEDGYKDLRQLKREELDNARQKLQIVFQDPYSSLNPSFTIFGSLEDPLIKFGVKSKQKRREIIGDLLESVNMPREYMTRYPNEFSGGQRQRIGIARALSVNPELIICDEAVSALDVSIQAQVLQLLDELKQKHNLTYIFITHDLSVVEYIADRVAVMYLGRIVELTDVENLYAHTLHPYTQALLSAIPIADLDQRRHRIPLQGDVPSPVKPPSGCPFHPRCKECTEECKVDVPPMLRYMIDGKPHYVACHHAYQKYKDCLIVDEEFEQSIADQIEADKPKYIDPKSFKGRMIACKNATLKFMDTVTGGCAFAWKKVKGFFCFIGREIVGFFKKLFKKNPDKPHRPRRMLSEEENEELKKTEQAHMLTSEELDSTDKQKQTAETEQPVASDTDKD